MYSLTNERADSLTLVLMPAYQFWDSSCDSGSELTQRTEKKMFYLKFIFVFHSPVDFVCSLVHRWQHCVRLCALLYVWKRECPVRAHNVLSTYKWIYWLYIYVGIWYTASHRMDLWKIGFQVLFCTFLSFYRHFDKKKLVTFTKWSVLDRPAGLFSHFFSWLTSDPASQPHPS